MSVDEEPVTEHHFKKVYRRIFGTRCENYGEHLVIAVHGMGDQRRNDMARCVAGLFATVLAKQDGIENQAIHFPMGLWEGDKVADPICDDIIGYAPSDVNGPGMKLLAELDFAEIYWADLTRDAEADGHRLEFSPQWAGSVVDRLRQRHDLKEDFSGGDIATGAAVVEHIAQSVNILGRLFSLTEKAGLFTFDLAKVVTQYLGDVQQVADYRYIRAKIRNRFLRRIEHLANISKAPNIHFVAHSEGTAVLLRVLLGAMNKNSSESPTRPGWLDRVRSVTTIGSPIDKHLILWPEMWGWLSEGEEAMVAASGSERERLLAERRTHWHLVPVGKKIRWRNYYDLADPVGYDLDTAREKLALWGCEAFEFEDGHDHGFRRYLLAGKAHVEYFGDTELFRHILADAILGEAPNAAIASRWRGKASPYIPFFLVAAIHIAAVAVLHQIISPEPSRGDEDEFVEWIRSGWGVFLCGLTLAGTTAASRIAVLSRNAWHTSLALAGHLVILCFLLWKSPGGFVDNPLLQWLGVPSLALILFGIAVDAKARLDRGSQVSALRWQMRVGSVAAAGAALIFLRDPKVSIATAGIGAGIFFYLWWLGAMLFDLSYVWKRYINTTGKTFLLRLRERMKWYGTGTRKAD